MEPRFNEVVRDWGNLLVISRVRYFEDHVIKNLWENNQSVRYIGVPFGLLDCVLYKEDFIISRLCSIHFTVTLAGLTNIVRYTEGFVIQRFVKSRFHCIDKSILDCYKGGGSFGLVPESGFGCRAPYSKVGARPV